MFKRKVTPIERFYARSPYSVVTMVARVRGDITETMLRGAASKVRSRHANLRARMIEGEDGDLTFSSEGAREIPVEVVARESDDHWIDVVQRAGKIPFEFEERPAIRFILVQSPAASELIILCHHILCDGMSLAYLARDLLIHLGDPAQEVQALPEPTPMGLDNFPDDVSLSPVARFFINRINRRWDREAIAFDQKDYRILCEAYWNRFQHQMLKVELSEEQTSTLVDRCRQEAVTVNTALAAAFVGAQFLLLKEDALHPTLAVGASLRERLNPPVGEVMGFYAGGVATKYKYNRSVEFWENARQFHEKLQPRLTDKHLFADAITYCYLEPGILEAMPFKTVGELVPPDSPRHRKLSAFSQRDDVVLSIMKREKIASLEKVFMGTAVTNLTRLDFPQRYGELQLDRLLMKPGGAFPLVNVNLLLGAVTCSGKLSLVLEYVEDNIAPRTMERIKDHALESLLGETRTS